MARVPSLTAAAKKHQETQEGLDCLILHLTRCRPTARAAMMLLNLAEEQLLFGVFHHIVFIANVLNSFVVALLMAIEGAHSGSPLQVSPIPIRAILHSFETSIDSQSRRTSNPLTEYQGPGRPFTHSRSSKLFSAARRLGSQ